MEQVQYTLSQLMETFHSTIANFEAELQKTQTSPNTSTTNTVFLSSEFSAFKVFIMESLNALQSQIHMVASAVDRLEMYGRRKMLLFHGIPEQDDENTSQLITEVIIGKLKTDGFVLMEDIKVSHRLGRSNNRKKPRPIIVKFQQISVRDKVWFDKSKLKGTGVTLSEYLTQSRRSAFLAAREKFGINRCWTQYGVIHVLGPNNTRHRITSTEELQFVEFEPIKASGTEELQVMEPEADKSSAAAKIAPKTRRAAATKK